MGKGEGLSNGEFSLLYLFFQLSQPRGEIFLATFSKQGNGGIVQSKGFPRCPKAQVRSQLYFCLQILWSLPTPYHIAIIQKYQSISNRRAHEGLRMDIWDRWMGRRGLFQGSGGVWGIVLCIPKIEGQSVERHIGRTARRSYCPEEVERRAKDKAQQIVWAPTVGSLKC